MTSSDGTDPVPDVTESNEGRHQFLINALKSAIEHLLRSPTGYLIEYATAVQASAYALVVFRHSFATELVNGDDVHQLEPLLLDALVSCTDNLAKSPIAYLTGNAMAVQAVAYALAASRGEITTPPNSGMSRKQTLEVRGIGSARLH